MLQCVGRGQGQACVCTVQEGSRGWVASGWVCLRQSHMCKGNAWLLTTLCGTCSSSIDVELGGTWVAAWRHGCSSCTLRMMVASCCKSAAVITPSWMRPDDIQGWVRPCGPPQAVAAAATLSPVGHHPHHPGADGHSARHHRCPARNNRLPGDTGAHAASCHSLHRWTAT
jgi:hypothetical protein